MSHRFSARARDARALGESLVRGNAPAEFVLVSGLLVALALATIHITLVVHVRHTLHASAWEGARLASYYNATSDDGAELTRRLITVGLGPGYAEGISAGRKTVEGQPVSVVSVVAPLPTVGLWSVGGEIRVEATAPLERPD
ncbi:MAG: TadE family protein [Pontimonas sp.]